MTSAAVEAIGVSKRFGSVTAVNNVTLVIGSGEFFSLLGPSGCGKTTFLRMLSGFEIPTSGRIVIAGRDMAGVPPHRRPANLVFQSYALFPHMSVFDNIAFGLRFRRDVSKAEIPKHVSWALDLVRLPGFAERFPAQLSGGQQQRVALARAVVNRPAVLLLDEPLSALDLKIRQEMQDELARLKRELPMTFVMVTHDQGEALALSSRIAVFLDGNLEQVGSPEEIYEKPRTAFVADFIGEANLLPARILERRGSFVNVAACGSNLWVKDSESSSGIDAGGSAVVWVRTHAIELAPAAELLSRPPAEPMNALEGRITNRSYQGEMTEFALELPEGAILKAACPAGTAAAFSIGQVVAVGIKASSASVLPPASTAGSAGTGSVGDDRQSSGAAVAEASLDAAGRPGTLIP